MVETEKFVTVRDVILIDCKNACDKTDASGILSKSVMSLKSDNNHIHTNCDFKLFLQYLQAIVKKSEAIKMYILILTFP